MFKKLVLGLASAGLLASSFGSVRAAEPDLIFGAPMALTGPWAFIGVAVNKGLNLAADEINAKGGIKGRKVSLLVEDTGSEKAQAVSIVSRQVLRDDVLGILGPVTTIELTAVGPLVNEKQVPLITNSPSTVVRDFGKWSFNVAAPPAQQMTALAKNSLDMLKIKRAVTVVVRENEGFIVQLKVVKDTWKSAGVEIVSEESISQNDTDFTALGTKLAGLNFDTLSLYMPPELAANVVVQARQAGMSDKVRIVVPPGVVAQGFIKTGGKAVEGTIAVADYSLTGGDPALNKSFVEGFQKKYGHPPENWAGVGYTALQMAAESIKNGPDKVTRDLLREGLGKIKAMPTVLGTGLYSLGNNRDPDYGTVMLTVKDGNFVAIK